ncbi:Nucleoporin nup84 [Rhizina undulata]
MTPVVNLTSPTPFEDAMFDQEEAMNDHGNGFGLVSPEVDVFALCIDSSPVLEVENLESEDSVSFGLELIQQFKDVAFGRVKAIQELNDEEEPDEQRMMDDLLQWKLEHQTWELFATLTSHRLDPNLTIQGLPEDVRTNRFLSNARVKDYLLSHDFKYQEFNYVFQWLQTYAPNPASMVEENEDRIGNRGGWLYTKEAIKSQKRILGPGARLLNFKGQKNAFGKGKEKGRDLVTELDPDAPTRQGRQIEEEDEDEERLLMKLVWAFIRKGDLLGARNLCAEVGDFWRAEILAGGIEAWDPVIDGAKEGDGLDLNDRDVSGNRRREIWRRMCYANAKSAGANEYERAVFGALSGDVESVIPVCHSWEDTLFAHINSLLEGLHTAMLTSLSRTPPGALQFPVFDSTAYHSRYSMLSEDDSVLPRIIDSMSNADHLKTESKQPLRVIQGALISLRFDDLVLELSRQYEKFRKDLGYDPLEEEGSMGLDVSDPRMLRVVVHIVLVLKCVNAGFTPGERSFRAGETVIGAYIEFLSEVGKFELIPLYARWLSPEKAVNVLGKVVIKIEDEKSRLEMLRLMRIHRINAEACLQKGMEICLDRTRTDYNDTGELGKGFFQTALEGEITENDRLLIRGLEWLMLGGEELRGELVRQGMVVYKRFLLTGRLAAAKMVYERINSKNIIPTDDMDDDLLEELFEPNEDLRNQFEDDETSVAAAIFVEFEVFVRAVLSLQEWRELMKKKPERPERSFKTILMDPFNKIVSHLPSIVNSWLDAEYSAQPELERIRNIYIPELTLALHNVYVDAGVWIHKSIFPNVLELSTVVTDPARRVINTLIDTGRVDEYLQEVARASRLMLSAGTGESGKGLGIWNVR